MLLKCICLLKLNVTATLTCSAFCVAIFRLFLQTAYVRGLVYSCMNYTKPVVTHGLILPSLVQSVGT